MAIPNNPALFAKLPKEYLEEDIGHRLSDMAIAFMVLQSLFVVLFYTSRHINKTLNGWDCWLFMPVSYIFSTGSCICLILIVTLGCAGRHLEAVLLEDPKILITRFKINKAVEIIYQVAITGSKLAILSLYLRIFSSRNYRIAVYIIGTTILLTWLTALVLSCTMCIPLAYQWDKSIPGGRCLNIMAVYQFICVPNIITDLMILALPLPALYKLHVNHATKIGLFVVFLVGSAGIITSVLRFVGFLGETYLVYDPTASRQSVMTYKAIRNLQYVIAESGTYLIAACMPSLRPLKRRLFPNHSFSKMVDSTLKLLSLPRFKRVSFGSKKKRGISCITDIHMEVRNNPTASTTDLNDGDYLVLVDDGDVLSSKISRDGR